MCLPKVRFGVAKDASLARGVAKDASLVASLAVLVHLWHLWEPNEVGVLGPTYVASGGASGDLWDSFWTALEDWGCLRGPQGFTLEARKRKGRLIRIKLGARLGCFGARLGVLWGVFGDLWGDLGGL